MEDCYFFIDHSVPEKDRTMSIMCVECHRKHPELGMFWEGSKNGYGPYEYKCAKCDKLIYGKDDNETEEI